jgi:catechol 2,3-dioxygenase-like lactoylglutathione lyase family enzyme
MIEVRRLGHATLTTPDLARQVAYYTEVVGLTLLEHDTKRALLASKQGFEAVALEPGAPNALSRLAFQVAPGSDLGELARELARHGVKSERRSGISPGVAEAIVFKDPKDTLIEVFSEYVFAREEPGQAGIMPLKLGHVAYRVNDVQQVVKFYTDVLGFRVSDWHGDTFAFLRCGPDHHTVNFVFDQVPQLHHIAFEVKDWAEIQRACEWLAKNNIHLVWGPAHHRPQHRNLSPQRRQSAGRVLLRNGSDEGRGARLFRPSPLAPGPPAASEGVGAGYAAELLGLWLGAHHPRLSDGGVSRGRSCWRGAQTA